MERELNCAVILSSLANAEPYRAYAELHRADVEPDRADVEPHRADVELRHANAESNADAELHQARCMCPRCMSPPR